MTTSVHLTFSFEVGDLVRLRAVFTREPTQAEIDDETAEDTDDWQPIDPDVVSVKTKDPNGDVDQYDYNGSPPGEVVRDDVGIYHLDVTATLAGTWFYRWYSTGIGQAANEDEFVVVVSNFA